MSNNVTLHDLIRRLASGENGRDMDAETAIATGWEQREAIWFKPPDTGSWELGPPRFTTSIDAQSALPGRIVSTWTRAGCGFEWTAECIAHGDPIVCVKATAPTEAAARLAALLKALEDTPT